MTYKYKLTVENEETGNVIYTDWAYSVESLEEKFYKIEKAVKEDEEKMENEKSEERLSVEFDKKYANGDFDGEKGTGDDDLPDFKDNWIANQL